MPLKYFTFASSHLEGYAPKKSRNLKSRFAKQTNPTDRGLDKNDAYRVRQNKKRINLIKLAAKTIQNQALATKMIAKPDLKQSFKEANELQLSLFKDLLKLDSNSTKTINPKYLADLNLNLYLKHSPGNSVAVKTTDGNTLILSLKNHRSEFKIKQENGRTTEYHSGELRDQAIENIKMALFHRTLRGIQLNSNTIQTLDLNKYSNLYSYLKQKIKLDATQNKNLKDEKAFIKIAEKVYEKLTQSNILDTISYVANVVSKLNPTNSDSENLKRGFKPIEYMMLKKAGLIEQGKPTFGKFKTIEELTKIIKLLPVQANIKVYDPSQANPRFTNFHTAKSTSLRNQSETNMIGELAHLVSDLTIVGYSDSVKQKSSVKTVIDDFEQSLYRNSLEYITELNSEQEQMVQSLEVESAQANLNKQRDEESTHVKIDSDKNITPEYSASRNNMQDLSQEKNDLNLKLSTITKINYPNLDTNLKRTILNTLQKSLAKIDAADQLTSFKENLTKLINNPNLIKYSQFKADLERLLDSQATISHSKQALEPEIIKSIPVESHVNLDQQAGVEPMKSISLNSGSYDDLLESIDKSLADLVTYIDKASDERGKLASSSLKSIYDFLSDSSIAYDGKKENFFNGMNLAVPTKGQFNLFDSVTNKALDNENSVKVRNKLVSVFDKLHTISRKLTGRDPINLFNFNLNKMETADALTELSQIVKTPPEKLPVISPEFCEVISALIPPKAQKLLNILQIDEYSKLGRLNLIQEDSSLMKSTNLGSYIHTSNARSAKNHTIFRSLIELEKLALNTNNRSKLRDEVYNTTIKYYDLLNGAFGKNTIKVLESLNLKTLKDIQVMDSNKESMLVELLEVKKAERSLAEILKIVDIINLLAQAD
jgi:hypothetical protein